MKLVFCLAVLCVIAYVMTEVEAQDPSDNQGDVAPNGDKPGKRFGKDGSDGEKVKGKGKGKGKGRGGKGKGKGKGGKGKGKSMGGMGGMGGMGSMGGMGGMGGGKGKGGPPSTLEGAASIVSMMRLRRQANNPGENRNENGKEHGKDEEHRHSKYAALSGIWADLF